MLSRMVGGVWLMTSICAIALAVSFNTANPESNGVTEVHYQRPLLSELDYQLVQLKYQGQQYEQLATQRFSELQDTYHLSNDLLGSVARRLHDFVRGAIHVEPFECGGVELPGIAMDTSTTAGGLRLDALARTGPSLFWAVEDMKSYVELLQTEGQVAGQYVQATCNRVKVLHAELACLAENPSTCPEVILEENLSKKLEPLDAAEQRRVLVVNRRLSRFKSLLHPYMPMIVAALQNPKAELRRSLLKLQEDDESSTKALRAQLEAIVREAIQLHAAQFLYETYAALPEAIRVRIEYGELEKAAEVARLAYEALNTIEKIDLDNLSDPAVRMAHSQLVLEQRRIRDFIEPAIALAQDLKDIPDIHQVLNEQAAKTVTEHRTEAEDKLCGALDLGTGVENEWGPYRWGRAPSADSVFGYRFVARPTGRNRVIGGVDRQLFTVRLELLLYVPTGEYASANVGAANPCVREGVETYKALDIGVSVGGVYQNDAVNSNRTNGFVLFEDPLVNTIGQDLEALKATFKQLGIPADWLTARVDVFVNERLDTVTLRIPLQEKVIDVEFLKNGQVVFRPQDFTEVLCEHLAATTVPQLMAYWAEHADLPVGDWRLRLKGSTEGSVQLTGCKTFVEQAEGQGIVPIRTSELATEVSLVLIGELEGNRFDWGAKAFINVSPGQAVLKSLVFDEIPDTVRAYLDDIFAKTRSTWSFEGIDDLRAELEVGAIATLSQTKTLSIPMSLIVTPKSCGSSSVSLSVLLPEGRLEIQEGGLEDTVKGLLECKAGREIRQFVQQNVKCSDFNGSLFGWNTVDISREAAGVNGCRLGVRLILADETVSLSNIRASVSDSGEFKLDLSDTKPSASFQTQLNELIRRTLGPIADSGLKVSAPRFSRDAMSLDVAVDVGSEIGRIDFGTLTLSADGKLNLSSEITNIVSSKLPPLLEPKLEALVMGILPEEVEDLDINLAFKPGEVSALARFKVKLIEDMPPIPAVVHLLPQFKANIVIDETYLKTQLEVPLQSYLNGLPLQVPPVTITPPSYRQGPDFDITMVTGIKMNLDALGSIEVDKIFISRHGVDFGGRVEIRAGIPIPLLPAPVPVFLTNPGVFYDYRAKEVGAIASLTIVAPDVDKLLQIEGVLSAGKEEFDDTIHSLVMKGQMILMESIPVVFTQGEVNFNTQEIKFDAETSRLFASILDASLGGELKPQNGAALLYTALRIFGADIASTDFQAHATRCPNRCIQGETSFKLPIGGGHVDAEFGPFLVDALLRFVIDLNIFGTEIGSGRLEAELMRATLDANVLKEFSIKVVTPALEQITPVYLAEILASLLDISLEDVIKWLKNPTFELAPAGSPGGDDGEARQDGGGAEGGSAPGSPGATANGKPADSQSPMQVLGDNADKSVDPNDRKKGFKLPKLAFPYPQQRALVLGDHVRACNPDGKRWGTLYLNPDGHWSFNTSVSGLSSRAYKLICEDQIYNGGTGPWSNQTQTRDVQLINDEFLPLRTFSDIRRTYGEKQCDVDGQGNLACITDDPTYTVEYYPWKDDSERYAYDINAYPYRYSYENVSSRYKGEASLSLSKSQAERLLARDFKSHSVQYELKRLLREEHDIFADVIIERLAKKEGFRRHWNPEYLVRYEVTKHAEQSQSYDHIMVWVNRNASRAIFEHRCHTWYWFYGDAKPALNCQELGKPELDERFLELLKINGIELSTTGGENILDPEETVWLLSEAIPSTIRGKNLPARGENVLFDRSIGGCDVQSITQFDKGEQRIFRVHKKLPAKSETELVGVGSVDIAVSKVGPHAAWAASDNDAWISTMVSFLACLEAPDQWLQNHSLWLEPDTTAAVNIRFLYSVKNRREQYYETVESIESGKAPNRFSIVRHDPYSLEFDRRERPLVDAAKRAFIGIIGEPNGQRITVVLNAAEDTESLVIENHSPGHAKVQVRKGNFSNRLPTQTAALADALVATEDLKRCMSHLVPDWADYDRGPDDTGVLRYLTLERPSVSTGKGPIQLFKAFAEDPSLNCSSGIGP